MINADIFTPLIIKDNLLDITTQEYIKDRVVNFNPDTTPGTTENY
jgi:hypothetical protein